ncbi:hypothetical protein [Microbacterium sp. XT11]|uniref:hypothetical protein n=1 Tax=Microbacterium sp. XT11 TaxID=367477 RepID=UPI0008351082|nr:hypothetical protein [Microbacterium sp. XT11]
MDDAQVGEIELITDGDGLALIGPSAAVERFLTSHGLASRDLELPRLNRAFSGSAAIAQSASEVAAQSGRWMKLTEESWAAAQKLPQVTNSSGNLQATLRAPNGQFAKNLQFVKGPGSVLTNPAMLAGAAGLMAQLAMQQTMQEITDYLAVIDEKIDDVLRAHDDAVLADMIGVDLVLDEAMTIREEVGRVSDVTWSKVQATSITIARTQAYALRRLDALAEKLETRSVNDLADVVKDVERKTQDWLSVLAHCFSLHEAVGVLELDRVFDTSPEELDRHRLALRAARTNRVELITRSTRSLLERMDAAAEVANSKVLFNPLESPAIVSARNGVNGSVGEFHTRLGIEELREGVDAKRWSRAVAETRDAALHAGGIGVNAALRAGAEGAERAARVGAEGLDKVRSLAGSVGGLAERTFRRRPGREDPVE